MDDKLEYESLPIPTYEEAIFFRPGSSRSHIVPEEIGDNAERQRLLQYDDSSSDSASRPRRGYQPPTVESARSSLDFLPSSGNNSARESMEQLRRELHQMAVDDSHQSSSERARSQLGQRFSKQLNSLTRTLSAIRLPLRKYLLTFKFSFPVGQAGWARDGAACILVLRMVGLLIVVGVIYLLFLSDVFSMGGRMGIGQPYDPSTIRNSIQGQINETSISDKLRRLTNFAHMAGTEGSYVLAEWIEEEFRNAGLEDVGMEEFQVYLNYPRPGGRRIAIVEPSELAWEATIEEDQVYTDPPRQQTLVFHGHSKSGNVTGPLIYAGYGSREDFESLSDRGIALNGSIVLARYYGSQGDRALKVKAAELAGAAGCIIYSDPAEDGFVRGPAYPDGRLMPRDGVQRGAVSLMSWVVGDVLTPGFASNPDEKRRLSPEESPGLPQIPSLPIAWRDAQQLLRALKGHGSKVPAEWVGGVPDVDEWWSGDQSSPIVNLVNLQDEVERQPIYNVLGRINGIEQPEKKIIVGNHRDSWCFGAADPGSGTAVILEIVRVFGELRKIGWRPLRTIEFASWDGEEYNLIGSTEHVENELDALRRDGFAYVNVDVGVSGTDFHASGSPLFERILLQILSRAFDPVSNKTLRMAWEEKGTKLGGLGAGSDYVAFQDMAGTSSIDLGFSGEPYPYHSCYENFEWMSNFGDPGFQHHRVLGEVLGLLVLELAEKPILPYDMQTYAAAVSQYVADLDNYARAKNAPMATDPTGRTSEPLVDLEPLYNAAEVFRENAAQFHKWDQSWYDTVYGSGGFESNVMAINRVSRNARMADFETHILDLEEGGGVPNRTQFKHIIFAPQAWSGYDEAYFPAIRDAIDSANWTETQRWIDRVAGILINASMKLNF
ncbi:hypothetical protein Egran_06821 [Elaphomyces granulatus]|uniref:Glutamate carboxypeptidase Tre2 n=1 Tax=Elaphomyces granulatus TaxID=519963 RepID=A0A232LMM8_9EURO|nr:hypothetical protein Egran_06821 [Elaphomyces granulatus]